MASAPNEGNIMPVSHDAGSSRVNNANGIRPDEHKQLDEHAETKASTKKSFGFWMIVVSLCLTVLVSSMDATIVVTAFPTISRDLDAEKQYVWVANSFVFASTTVQPLVSQLSDIFGRRNPMLISIVLFALGSGIAGGATNVAMLIGGRTVQGLGSGGIMVLVELIVCDLVSLRERGQFLGIIMGFAGIGVTVGPIVGGALAQANWRWIFWLNLPPCGAALLVMIFYLKMKHKREETWKAALIRVDYFGSVLFIASISAILLGLVMGGTIHPWSSWRIIVPLVLGFLGWAAFHVFEASRFCKEPSIPPRIFGNRTTFAALILNLIGAMLLEWVTFFLPIYFMGVRTDSPLKAGINVLPYTVIMIPFSMIAGVIMTKTGLYRPLHWAGFGLLAVSCGLISMLDSRSSKAEWVWFELINGAGQGLIMMTLLPTVLAPLPESDVGAATGTFSFLRGFGFVWGITLPSIIFNGQFDKYLPEIDSAVLRGLLENGAAYGYASGGFMATLEPKDREQVVRVFTKAMEAVWQAAAAFAALGFWGVWVEKHVELRTELQTEYGIDEKKKVKDIENQVGKDESLKTGE